MGITGSGSQSGGGGDINNNNNKKDKNNRASGSSASSSVSVFLTGGLKGPLPPFRPLINGNSLSGRRH